MAQTIDLGFTPYDKQYEVIGLCTDYENGIKFIVVPTGRQVGKTLTGEAIILIWSTDYPNSEVCVVQPFYRQAMRIMEEILKAIEKTPLYKNHNKTEQWIDLSNGTRIWFFGAENPDAIRGNTFDFLWIDEAAFVGNDAWNKAIKPTQAIKGKKVLFTTTPNGASGWVYDLAELGKDPDSPRYIHITWRSIDSPFMPKDERDELVNKELAGTLPLSDRQEYYAEWIDFGAEAIFKKMKLVRALNTHASYANGKLYISADVSGSGNDDTVIVVWDGWDIIDIEKVPTKTITESTQAVRRVMREYGVPASRTIVDGTGLGQAVVEALRCKKYAATASPREKTYSNKRVEVFMYLSAKFEQNEIAIKHQRFYDQIIKELTAFKLEETARDGKLRLIAKAEIKSVIGHSPDIADAIAMRSEFDIVNRSNARPIKFKNKQKKWIKNL